MSHKKDQPNSKKIDGEVAPSNSGRKKGEGVYNGSTVCRKNQQGRPRKSYSQEEGGIKRENSSEESHTKKTKPKKQLISNARGATLEV